MNLKRIFSVLLLMAGLAGFAVGQTALNMTTLASAVNGPIGAGYSGTAPTNITGDTNVFLASVTGIAAPVLPGAPVSVIYVGREAMAVWTVNTTLKVVNVSRGYLGTQAAPQPSGDMVLVANQYSTNLATGANPIPSGLFQVDPPLNGSCVAANTPTTPWVNVLTGAQWLCSTITKTWVPGFQNPLVPVMSAVTTAVASATTILPSGPLFHLTGTTSVTTITQPVGCNATAVGGCQFTFICDGVCTWAASGNIATAAGTVVAGTAITFIWDATNSKWYPNVVT